MLKLNHTRPKSDVNVLAEEALPLTREAGGFAGTLQNQFSVSTSSAVAKP